VHQDLVEHARVEALLGGVSTKDDDVPVASGALGGGDGLLDVAADKVKPAAAVSGASWVSTNIGPVHAPPYGLPSSVLASW
jgi:hypothetical protein